MTCLVDDCSSKKRSRGYCSRHYNRFMRYGDPLMGRRYRERHNLSGHELFNIWHSMVKRTTVPSTSGYENYGGRGIKVCDRWITSFSTFLEDMGERPSSEHSIDRIDNDKDYSPENCRWATKRQQSLNKRNNKRKISSYRGVCLDTLGKRWRAYIKPSGKYIHLGVFSAEVDAAKAYDSAAVKYFGNDAVCNFMATSDRSRV